MSKITDRANGCWSPIPSNTLYFYHGTCIVAVFRDNGVRIVVNHGGWITQTTTRKINDALYAEGLSDRLQVYRHKGVMYAIYKYEKFEIDREMEFA